LKSLTEFVCQFDKAQLPNDLIKQLLNDKKFQTLMSYFLLTKDFDRYEKICFKVKHFEWLKQIYEENKKKEEIKKK
jgi:hypothetical protein